MKVLVWLAIPVGVLIAVMIILEILGSAWARAKGEQEAVPKATAARVPPWEQR